MKKTVNAIKNIRTVIRDSGLERSITRAAERIVSDRIYAQKFISAAEEIVQSELKLMHTNRYPTKHITLGQIRQTIITRIQELVVHLNPKWFLTVR